MKYQIDGLLKFAEEDVYNDGCQPDTSTSYMVDLKFEGSTPDKVIEKVAVFLGVETSGENNGVEKNACDVKGRVDFATMECADSTQPSKSEIAQWKKGKLKLWYCIYTGHVEKVSVVNL